MALGQEVIKKDGKIFAHVIRKSHRPDGVKFITPADYTLQLGLIGHPAGHVIADHIHNPDVKYQVDTIQEFLYIESGKVQVTIYDYDWQAITQLTLSAGDILFQVLGGHGFKVLEPCYMIEVKQGPFPGDHLMNIKRLEPIK